MEPNWQVWRGRSCRVPCLEETMSRPGMVTAGSSQLQHQPESASHHDWKLQPGKGAPSAKQKECVEGEMWWHSYRCTLGRRWLTSETTGHRGSPSKGNQLRSKKKQMENITHTTPTSCTSHHLTKWTGRDECIEQQKQGQSRLGSGEKRYLTQMETVLLLMEARLFTNLIGKEKKVHFS